MLEAKLQPWLAETLTGLNNGMRRPENEGVIGLFNLTTQGVLSNHKLHFTLSQLTSMSHNSPKSFIGVLVLPNRAGDLRVKSLVHYAIYFGHLWTYCGLD